MSYSNGREDESYARGVKCYFTGETHYFEEQVPELLVGPLMYVICETCELNTDCAKGDRRAYLAPSRGHSPEFIPLET